MTDIFRRHFAGIITLILVAAGVWGISYSYKKAATEQAEREAMLNNNAVPRAVLGETEFSWGNVDRNAVARRSFTLKNAGNAPLKVTFIATSCGCTTARLVLGDAEAKLPANIPPGGKGEIKVEFDPAAMDVRGNVERAVRIETNDPKQPFLIINLHANVR